MYIIHWTITTLQSNALLLPLLAVSAGIFTIAASIVFFCRDRGVYFAFYFVVVGVSYLLLSAIGTPITTKSVCLACEGILCAVVYFFLQIALAAKLRAQRKKREREEYLRQLQYTLPEKDNTFIRTRLNTVLHTEPSEHFSQTTSESFRMDHARTLLAKLKAAPLTPAERLQTQDVEKLFFAYLKKDRWTAEDIRSINELFAYLLKLSAKYSV